MDRIKEKIRERVLQQVPTGVDVDDERVIIRTKLEKPSKIKGLALI